MSKNLSYEEWLYAECVIRHLKAQSIIIDERDWQRQHPNDQEYSENFDGPGVACITLCIIKRSGQYYTLRSTIGILARSYPIDANTILTNCVI